jgi:hypothetical protein
MLEGLAPFFRERRYPAGHVIFRKGATANSIYFITRGEVTLWEPLEAAAGTPGGGAGGGAGSMRSVRSSQKMDLGDGIFGTRLVRYVSDAIVGGGADCNGLHLRAPALTGIAWMDAGERWHLRRARLLPTPPPILRSSLLH